MTKILLKMVNPEPEGLGQTKKVQRPRSYYIKDRLGGWREPPGVLDRHPQQLIYIYMTLRP